MSDFSHTIDAEADLRRIYRAPADLVGAKVLHHLDEHARSFIAGAPFVLIGSTSPDGTGDVSPKGGPAGFVAVLDDRRIAIPDLSGNNLLDTLTNVVHGSGIGLLFLIPGRDETLRVNGRACLTTDPHVLDACAVKDRRPKVAIGVSVTQQYMHCAKALRRSELWRPETWTDPATHASLGCIIVDQIPTVRDLDPAVLDSMLEDGYSATMWEPGGSE